MYLVVSTCIHTLYRTKGMLVEVWIDGNRIEGKINPFISNPIHLVDCSIVMECRKCSAV